MQIKEIEISKIIPYENNPRNNDEAVDKVANSIKEFGFKQPIVLDKNNVIVIGHTRLKASEKLGLEKVPCLYADDLTDDQIKALRLADNKTSEFATWDFEKLDLEIDNIELDLEPFGFDLDLAFDDDEVVEDEVPDVPEEPKAKLGDIYQLGEHRLMCGDATKIDDIEKLTEGGQMDLLFTDPPYNVNIEQKKKKILHCNEYNKIENDDLSQEEFQIFLSAVFENANKTLKDDASYYVFSCQGGDNEMMMMMMMRENGIKCRHQIIWVKDSPVFSMGRLDYDYKHEPILYGWKKKHNFYRKGTQDKSVWEFDRVDKKLHPTMKPIELIANALNNSTKENDKVIDLFGGSGSTLIACEQLNRKCYMCEIDPHYIDVIIERWENFTGKKAKKVN